MKRCADSTTEEGVKMIGSAWNGDSFYVFMTVTAMKIVLSFIGNIFMAIFYSLNEWCVINLTADAFAKALGIDRSTKAPV